MPKFTVEVMELVPHWTKFVIEAETHEDAQRSVMADHGRYEHDKWTLGDTGEGPLFVNAVWTEEYAAPDWDGEECSILPEFTEDTIYCKRNVVDA